MLKSMDVSDNDIAKADSIPPCYKCEERCMQDYVDLVDGSKVAVSDLVGCKRLGVKAWAKGWHRDKKSNLLYQHNCPLLEKNLDKK